MDMTDLLLLSYGAWMVEWSIGRDMRLPACDVDLQVTDYYLTRLGTGDGRLSPGSNLPQSR